MRAPRTTRTLGYVTAMLLAVLMQAALVSSAAAQQSAASAELRRVVGRVELSRAGQSQWVPAVAGARLVEGDDVRAFSGASAELLLPDTSLVVLAENSRLRVGTLEFNPQQQSRLVLLHLAVGKLRAVIAQAGITLVRARQSNFAISTPTAVATARGTIVWVGTWLDPSGQRKTLMAVEPEPGLQIPSRIECITLATTDRRRQLVLAGSATTDCTAPVPTPGQFLTFSNPLTAGANLGAALVTPSTVAVLALVTTAEPGSAGIERFSASATSILNTDTIIFSWVAQGSAAYFYLCPLDDCLRLQTAAALPVAASLSFANYQYAGTYRYRLDVDVAQGAGVKGFVTRDISIQVACAQEWLGGVGASPLCPGDPALKVMAVWQPFEHGVMIWFSDTKQIFVMSGDGRFQ